MKITIYELLGMIKDGKAPKKILFKEKPFEYEPEDKDYYFDNGLNKVTWLFDEYVITDILNDEVQVLEITVTINNNEHTKIEKIDRHSYVLNSVNKILTEEMIVKINALIDRVNDMEV